MEEGIKRERGSVLWARYAIEAPRWFHLVPTWVSFLQQIGSGGMKVREVSEREREDEGGRFFSLSPALSFFPPPECLFGDIIPQRHHPLSGSG